jgi:hypothetical protein
LHLRVERSGVVHEIHDEQVAIGAGWPNRACEKERRNRVGMATYAASPGAMSGLAAFVTWSEKHPDHHFDECEERWNNYKSSPPTKIGAATLFYMADEAQPGWKKPSACSPQTSSGSGLPFKIISAPDLSSLDRVQILLPSGHFVSPSGLHC